MGLKDDMWRLEAKGMESDVREGAAPARQQNIMFVRGETQVQSPIEKYVIKGPTARECTNG
jgi:hypothetical protein